MVEGKGWGKAVSGIDCALLKMWLEMGADGWGEGRSPETLIAKTGAVPQNTEAGQGRA